MFLENPRPFCWTCRKARKTCYCNFLPTLEAKTRFVILQHPKEARNAIGTARLAHLSLAHSLLLEGVDFSEDKRLNALLNDPGLSCAILYPGPQSRSLNQMTEDDVAQLIPSGRRFVLFVIDGTWRTARPILRLSTNLAALPRVSFESSSPSAYVLRRQPREECLSTVEAIGRVLGLLESAELENRLLTPFRQMVAQQLTFARGRRGRVRDPRIDPGNLLPGDDDR